MYTRYCAKHVLMCAHFPHSLTMGIHYFRFYSGFYSSFPVSAVFYAKFMHHFHNCRAALVYYVKVFCMYTRHWINANSIEPYVWKAVILKYLNTWF